MAKTIKPYWIILFVLCTLHELSAQDMSRNHYATASEYLKNDSLQLALIELDSATNIASGFADAYALKGKIWEKKGDYRKAMEQFDLAIKHDPGTTSNYLIRAELHFKLKDHRDYILNDVDKAIHLNPNTPELYALKAYYYAHTFNPTTLTPDYDNAIQTISIAISLDPQQAEYLFTRSQYKFENEQRLSALADISLAIEKEESNDSFYNYRGLIRFMMGDYRKALNDMTMAIELNTNKFEYYQLRGNVLYNLARYDKAYQDYSSAIDLLFKKITQSKSRLRPNDPLNHSLRQTLLLRGMALVQENKPYDGCDDFKRALQMGDSKASNYIRKYCQ